MSFPYRNVLVIGASSGIGHGMAERLIETGSHVIVVGRRKDRLDSFVTKYGADKVSAVAFDISKRDEIPKFANDIITSHPTLDCVFLNAGIQSRIDLTTPTSSSLAEITKEIEVNFTSFVALTYAFLPFLSSKPSTSIIFTGSNLAIVPAAPLPGYSASKAALNAFVLCLREQLKAKGMSPKVIELSPPPVQTELHDKQLGPELGRKMGMPLREFTDKAFAGIFSGSDQVYIGHIGPEDVFYEMVDKRRMATENLMAMMSKWKVPTPKE